MMLNGNISLINTNDNSLTNTIHVGSETGDTTERGLRI